MKCLLVSLPRLAGAVLSGVSVVVLSGQVFGSFTGVPMHELKQIGG